MIGMLIAALVIFLLLRLAEYLRKTGRMHGEISRKFVHITVGTFIAFWPFFIDIVWVQFMCLAFFVVVLASRYFKWFPAIHGIERKTWGDILFPLGIGLTVLVADSPWIFAAAMLHLSLADGFAAVVGEKHGRTNRYLVFGYPKSYVGSATFLVISVGILAGLLILSPQFSAVGASMLLWLPLIATVLENVATKGMDNIIVPVVMAFLLNSLQLFG